MFNKQKYNRKRGNRKPFRRKIRKRGVSLRPVRSEDPAFTHEKPVFDASGSPLYSWMYIPPQKQSRSTISRSNGSGFTSSLSEECAKIIGANADALLPHFLEEGSWSSWQGVWNAILENGTDSPDLFRMFARRFGDQSAFSCHCASIYGKRLVYTSSMDMRDKSLEACLVPFYRKHRVENVFSNVAINDFVSFVGGLHGASVVIDCSKMPAFKTSEILMLCNIPSLRGLDLSGNRQIDDQLLYTLASRLALRESKLEILVLSSCPYVSEKGLLALFDSRGTSSLSYVESDVRLPSLSSFEKRLSGLNGFDETDVVKNTQWKVAHETDKIAAASKHKLGLKLHFLSRELKDLKESEILWDLKFFPSSIDFSSADAENLLISAWKQRYQSAVSRPLELPFIYTKDTEITAVSCSNSTDRSCAVQKNSSAQSSAAGNAAKRNSKKPKTINTTAQAFFFGS